MAPRTTLFAFLVVPLALAETRSLSLKDTVRLALEQSPDLVLARYDEIRQNQAVRLARDPFTPKLFVGSGLGYNNGFPMSIDGAAPSVAQARASAALFNRPQKLKIAQELENARGLRHQADAKRADVAHAVTLAWLDTQKLARLTAAARRQVAPLQQVLDVTAARVAEGRAIPLDELRVKVELERARQRAADYEGEASLAEASLAILVGQSADDRIQPGDEPALFEMPESEEAAIRLALENSAELRRLQSALLAKGHEAAAGRAARLPKVDLFAQYGLFAKFNNYEDYFRRFQRHNGQVGMSIQLPVFNGAAAQAQAGIADAEISRLRVDLNSARNRLTQDTRRAWNLVKSLDRSRDLARLTLDLAREEVSVALARFAEGRISAKELEELRFAEGEKWMAFYEAQTGAERARAGLLHHAGLLLAALR